jgi:hypothetical protein
MWGGGVVDDTIYIYIYIYIYTEGMSGVRLILVMLRRIGHTVQVAQATGNFLSS